jgi:cytochrome d ubiquinol oxidase subunit II
METLWFCLVAVLLAGYVVLDGFDLGAGIVQLFVAETGQEKSQVLQTIGGVWSGNEVWLVAAGGTISAVFPALYASAFSGFYLALMIALWLLILRGVSLEFRNHSSSPLWQPFWDTVLAGASVMLAIFFGVALGNVVRGVPLDSNGYFFLPLWTNLLPGNPAGIIDWYTLLAGAVSFLALAFHGSLWVIMKIEGKLQERTRSFGAKCWAALFSVTLLISIASCFIQPNLTRQFQSHPWGVVFPLFALAGLIGARMLSSRRKDVQAFLASGLYLVGMLTSAAFGVFPKMLPSNPTPDLSLTIYNASASHHGLVIALCWLIPGMALVTAYSFVVFRHFAGKIEEQ